MEMKFFLSQPYEKNLVVTVDNSFKLEQISFVVESFFF